VLAEAGDVPTTELRLNAYRRRVVILDLTMAGESSLSVIPRMRETPPDTQIVVLTMHNDPAFARGAHQARIRRRGSARANQSCRHHRANRRGLLHCPPGSARTPGFAT